MDKYRYELHAPRKNNDLIVDRYEQFYNADGELQAESKPHTLCVHPGIVDPDWPWHIRAIVSARHVPTVINKHKAEQAHRAAEEALSTKPDKKELKDAEKAARKAMKAAQKAHDEFIENED